MAELEAQVNDLSRKMKGPSGALVAATIGVPVLLAIGVAVMGLMTPVDAEPLPVFALLTAACSRCSGCR